MYNQESGNVNLENRNFQSPSIVIDTQCPRLPGEPATAKEERAVLRLATLPGLVGVEPPLPASLAHVRPQ